MAHHREGRLAEAAECYRRVPASDPEYENALYQLGVIAHQEGRFLEAIAAYRRALAIDPALVDGQSNLANALQELGRFDEALIAYRAALAIDPSREGLWYAAGCAESARKHYVAAVTCFRRALAIAPEWHEAQHNLAQVLFNLGQVDEALGLFRRAAEGPHSALPRSMIAVVIPGSPTSDNQAILDARSTFADRDLPAARTVAHERSHHPRLRVGYLSSFFHRHNWMKPVWGLINQHDRETIDVHLFSDAPASAIQYGYRPQSGDQYHDISASSCEAVADRIEHAGIDVLVDLNGYSAMRRLPIAALKPAPVLIGWFNMFATTGMATYDCLIGDAEVAPPEEERFYRERVERVPGSYLTFEVGYPVPDIVVRPGGGITFGCLAPLYKITTDVISVWRRILDEVPDSTLLLKGAAFAREDERRFVRDQFPEGRVRLEGPADHFEFLKTYDRIDIALDTFPYNGGTTTTEAIWQGVPVVTFWGDRWVARTSASILRAGGLGELVRRDVDDYVACAVEWSQAPRRLSELRATMRERLTRSPVCGTAGFARHMERLYRT